MFNVRILPLSCSGAMSAKFRQSNPVKKTQKRNFPGGNSDYGERLFLIGLIKTIFFKLISRKMESLFTEIKKRSHN